LVANGPPKAEPLFRWETLRDIGPFVLRYRDPVPGRICAVDLTGGPSVRVWKADDGQSYFCHGLTFGGTSAPGGPVSPFSGPDVATILRHHYTRVDPEAAAVAGDILVWWAPDDDTPHSAILIDPVAVSGGDRLAYDSTLRTKNGREPETTMTLEELIGDYFGEGYNVYRRR
jgi:hypothetical protein